MCQKFHLNERNDIEIEAPANGNRKRTNSFYIENTHAIKQNRSNFDKWKGERRIAETLHFFFVPVQHSLPNINK